jgi:hypothetical protein
MIIVPDVTEGNSTEMRSHTLPLGNSDNNAPATFTPRERALTNCSTYTASNEKWKVDYE